MKIWGRGARVEVYDFNGESWRRGIVVEPCYEIDGFEYLHIRYVDDRPLRDSGPPYVWVAPELAERHVRAAAW